MGFLWIVISLSTNSSAGASINDNKNLGSLEIVLWTCLFSPPFFQFSDLYIVVVERIVNYVLFYKYCNDTK